MNKTFVFLIKRPSSFDSDKFKIDIVKEFKALGVNICKIEEWKQFGVDQEGDILEYEFETNYFDKVNDNDYFTVGRIYEEIIDLKRAYNDKKENSIKIGPIVLKA